jgi:energy-coupling factor transporter ATP-binding protein EcfA2
MKEIPFYRNWKGEPYEVGTKVDNKFLFDFRSSLSYMKLIARDQNPDFFLNPNDKRVFEQLFYYFTKSADYFKSNEISFQKGLLIVGKNGVGKSTILKMFTEFFFEQKSRFYHISNLAKEANISGISSMSQINFKHDFCLDDVGSEQKSMYYGNNFEIFGEIMKEYERVNFPSFRPEQLLCSSVEKMIPNGKRKNAIRPARIYATTNLTLDEIKERYGARIHSRTASYFNIVNFPTEIDKRVAKAKILR